MCWQKEQPHKPTKPNTLPETIQYKGRKCNSLSKFFHGNYPQPSDVLRGSRCSHSRSCADVGENVKSVDGYSQRSQHVSMIHKRHTHTHQLMPSADTSASCLYSNLHSVTVGHRRVLRAFRKSPAPRGYAMRMQRYISVRRSRTDESEEKQAAAVLAAKCRIAAATYRTRLRIGTACGIFPIFY